MGGSISALLSFWNNYGIILATIILSIIVIIYWLVQGRGKKGTTDSDVLDKLKGASLLPASMDIELQQEYRRIRGAAILSESSGSSSKGEKECRRVAESYFNKPFPRVRPNFMKNPSTGKNLELDMYCKELSIAIEYDGIQHYQFTPTFHGTYDKFMMQYDRDKLKERICRERGIHLIRVPYSLTIGDIEQYLHAKFRQIGY